MDSELELRPVPDAPDYAAGSDGRVYSRKGAAPRPLRPSRADSGHLRVGLWQHGVRRGEWVHRLVALAFHGAPPTEHHEVRHRNGDPADNRPANLAWGTRAENIADRVPHGVAAVGERHGMAKLTAAQAAEIRRRAAAGESQRAIARDFNVTPATVSMIRRGRIWAHGPATEA